MDAHDVASMDRLSAVDGGSCQRNWDSRSSRGRASIITTLRRTIDPRANHHASFGRDPEGFEGDTWETHSDESQIEEIRANTFIDAEQMKERVRRALLKPSQTKADYYKHEGWAQSIARSQIFEQLTLFIIAFNAIWIAHDTDANHQEVLIEAEIKFQIAENFFCCFFSAELFIRFMAFQRKRNCLKDAWFVFDSALVLMMVLETWVMTMMLVILGTHSGGFGDASIIRIARLLRLSRMARMARLLRAVPELMILIKGMVAAIRSVIFTIVLLVIIMYVFAIGLTQITAGSALQSSHFESVPSTMYALMMHGCLLDAPKELSDALGEESWLYPPIFWLFVLMAALTVMNMLVGVLCEVVSAVAATEKEENLVSFVKGRVWKIVEEIDQDGDMSISKNEFKQILENVHACRALQDVGVDVIGLVDFAETIFEDENGREKESLSFPDFMDLVLQLRGSNVATVKDIVELRKLIRGLAYKVHEIHKSIKKGSRGTGDSLTKAKSDKALGDRDTTAIASSLADSASGFLTAADMVEQIHCQKILESCSLETSCENTCASPCADLTPGNLAALENTASQCTTRCGFQDAWEPCPVMDVPAPRWWREPATLPGEVECSRATGIGEMVPVCPPPMPLARSSPPPAPSSPPPIPHFMWPSAQSERFPPMPQFLHPRVSKNVVDVHGLGSGGSSTLLEKSSDIQQWPRSIAPRGHEPCNTKLRGGLREMARLSSLLHSHLLEIQQTMLSEYVQDMRSCDLFTARSEKDEFSGGSIKMAHGG
mmetsp:Transcript_140864/g.357866  ORF Transcript_140864/g.357866 Transcript_140864/m.357866 type:complete len:772 (-) Transcript_140864:154-2469(-)|eukprot:CAMPEP_0115520680 /NCGR_PEP_ID=MMETSP0271-20121206/79122_1 /TAXON_ID=71861 /ORGANISM="Scrippsiella trochoidea, Strain CCMP3099" /LENGTH=771 /DNA_ID=CAMNT_0002951821 /DNA_START=50 /DNA_END=2365 /DNA_ORIENTATION=-